MNPSQWTNLLGPSGVILDMKGIVSRSLNPFVFNLNFIYPDIKMSTSTNSSTSDNQYTLFKVFMPPEASSMMSQTLKVDFTEGARVKEFSSEIAKFIGNPRVVPVSSCTMALTIAFQLSGVGPGTGNITALTCVAGNEPIRILGAKPVWADVDRRTGMLTADKIEPLIVLIPEQFIYCIKVTGRSERVIH